MKTTYRNLIFLSLLIGSNYLTYQFCLNKTTTKFHRDLITQGLGHYNDLLDFELYSVKDLVIDYIVKRKIEESLNKESETEENKNSEKKLDLY